MISRPGRLLFFALVVSLSCGKEAPLTSFPQPMWRPIPDPALYRLFLEQVAAFADYGSTKEVNQQRHEALRNHFKNQFGITGEELSRITPLALRFQDQLRQLESREEALAAPVRLRPASLPDPALLNLQKQIDTLSPSTRDELWSALGIPRFRAFDGKLRKRDTFHLEFARLHEKPLSRPPLGAFYSYVSIDLDAATQMVTAYSHAEIQAPLVPYYRPELRTALRDRNSVDVDSRYCSKLDAKTTVCELRVQSPAYIVWAFQSVNLLARSRKGKGWFDPSDFGYVDNLNMAQNYTMQFIGAGPPRSEPDHSLPIGSVYQWTDW